MTDQPEPETPALNLRQRRMARTRAAALAAARKLFERDGYADTTMRRIAREMKMSTGAIFANFAGKDDLYQAAMGQPPPTEARIAALRAALAGLWAVRPCNWADDDDPRYADAWRACARALRETAPETPPAPAAAQEAA